MKRLNKFFTVFMTVCLLGLVVFSSVAAEEANEKVLATRSGVMQVRTYLEVELVDGTTSEAISSGTCFIVNENTIITNAHVVDKEMLLTDPDLASAGVVDLTISEIKVVVRNDVMIDATVNNLSREMDFAILNLSQSISGKQPLTLASSEYLDSISTTANVYALGFPGRADDFHQHDATYTEDDITITHGTISGVTTKLINNKNVPIFMHQASISGGNSGGPLVTSDGVVIGVNTWSYSGDSWSTRISEVTSILDALGIPYQKSSDNPASQTTESEEQPTSKPAEEKPTEDNNKDDEINTKELESLIGECEKLDKASYDESSWQAFDKALKEANSVLNNNNASQADVDKALGSLQQAKSELQSVEGNNMMLIIIIGVAAVLIIVIIIIIIVLISGKKKKRQTTIPARPNVQSKIPNNGVGQGGQPQRINNRKEYSPEPISEQTTVLSSDSSSEGTMVLGQENPRACLIRKNTGERIDITKSNFRVGKERGRVDYCVNNSSVSRLHATIISRNGAYYIIDHGTTNHTYVDGRLIASNAEVEIKNGTEIKMSNEIFEFKVG